MFKRLKQYIYNLSLTHQLLWIILLLSTIFLGGVIPYLTKSVQSIGEQQVYTDLLNQQSQIISLFETSNELFPNNKDKATLKVNHLIYDVENDTYQSLSSIKQEDLVAYQYYIFRPALLELLESGKSQGYYKTTIDGEMLYMVLSKSTTNPSLYWISYSYSEISNQLFKLIQKRLVLVFYAVILIFTLIMCLWIYTMIRPLKAIRRYIDDIKDNKPSTISITRKDEIGQVGTALIEMNESLNKQKQLQTDLIHNISHDLKTPIAIIKNYIECMKDGIYPYGDENSSLDVIYHNATRLENKVKDFLYLNRLDYLKEQQTSQTVDLGDVINELVEDLKILNHDIEIQLDLKPAVFPGEKEHWYSCIMNIVDNALRYAKSKILIQLRPARLIIFNDGEPIEPSLLTHIFEPYSKGTKGNYGLGMSIVYKICTMYHCDIQVNNLDSGVQFTILKKHHDNQMV